MNETTYNGWTNKETWNTALWMGNEESLYKLIHRVLSNSKNEGDFATHLESFLLIIWDGKTPDGLSLDPVNFSEIAEAWWEDYKSIN